MLAPTQHLDPLRVLHGIRDDRYDCPDVPTLDRHITRLRRRMTSVALRSSNVADVCRADIDRLLDRRAWLTLPVAVEPAAADHDPAVVDALAADVDVLTWHPDRGRRGRGQHAHDRGRPSAHRPSVVPGARPGRAISGADYAIAFVDEIDKREHHQQRFSVAY